MFRHLCKCCYDAASLFCLCAKMSDSHHLGTSPSLGEVEHIAHLSEHIGSLFWNEDYSDITLLIEGQRIPSHKVILASRSEYFRYSLFNLTENWYPCCKIPSFFVYIFFIWFKDGRLILYTWSCNCKSYILYILTFS